MRGLQIMTLRVYSGLDKLRRADAASGKENHVLMSSVG
jgi:hypothetical protein